MPLSWNEIKARAIAFSREWKDASDERALAQTFWIEFFGIFGIRKPRVASFEHAVVKYHAERGFVDLFWPGVLLVEHKSRGKSLDRAFTQAMDYFGGIKERDLPRYVLVTDFKDLRLEDLEAGTSVAFPLEDLHKHIKRFAFIAGYESQTVTPQDPVNVKAAEKMGLLHDALSSSGYQGHKLEVLLVRLLFCMFADNTGIFQPAQSFRTWLDERTSEEGSDLGAQLTSLFQILNSPEDARSTKLDESLKAFAYVNGRLFSEHLPIPSFDAEMRELLLECCALDWSSISPAIFGAMFQSIMAAKERRNLGAHYTSEENILKVIRPLFLDDLHSEYQRVRANRARLVEFHEKLRRLRFLDPACGCGNFLVITYRELRLLELEILRDLYGSGQQVLDIDHVVLVDVDQFYGIEIEEFPAQIAQVALWLIDHQMNLRVSSEFGHYFARIPLRTSASVTHANALQVDWASVLRPDACSYLLGNPPFVGAMVMSDEQRADMAKVFDDLKGYGVLDLVCAWYWKAAKYMRGQKIRAAFVSTNSIAQGEQVGLLWKPLVERFGLRIFFAHRTFKWSNEARGIAAVHCVVIGFDNYSEGQRKLFEYPSSQTEPHLVPAAHINAYLVDAPDVFLPNRSTPLCDVPKMRFGSMPRDGGNLILSDQEKEQLVAEDPPAARWIRPYTGAQEFLNGQRRWCLWLVGVSPSDLRASPSVMARIEKVRQFRLASKAESTRRFAATPSLFCQLAEADSDYILVPRVSSERRQFVPMAMVPQHTIGNDQVFMIPGANLYHLGVLSSTMHNAWIRFTCGRLKSDYRYSKDVTYNNFPWPQVPAEAGRARVVAAAEAMQQVRASFAAATLADLYHPLTMPPQLIKAHRDLDAAVDSCYGRRAFLSDADRVAFLFQLYAQRAGQDKSE